MKYEFDGEIYHRLHDLIYGGPIGKRHPTTISLYIEGGNLFVVLGADRTVRPSFAYSARLVSPNKIVIDPATQTPLD